MTTSKPEVKRYDCTSGGRSHCYGCYTMTETEDGYYVSAEDYEALQAECEKLRKAALKAAGDRLEREVLTVPLPEPAEKQELEVSSLEEQAKPFHEGGKR